MTIRILGGQYVDVLAGRLVYGDIYIGDGKILEVGDVGDKSADETIDGRGLVVSPGFVDMHVHFRDPGLTHKEDLFSGGEAAAAGGYTAVCTMPNTKPVCDCPEVIHDLVERSSESKVRVYPVSAVTSGMEGKRLVDFAAVRQAGAIAVSDDGLPVYDQGLLWETMRRCQDLGMPVLLHCEDLSITRKGLMHEGEISRRLEVSGVHRASEDVSTAAAVALSAATGLPCHICHVSTAGSLAVIREAKRRGVPVTCEVTPHHMMLTHHLLESRDANYRMAPPLRENTDVAAVLTALADGTADCIATDHAPHTAEEKSSFVQGPNGVVGLETAFAAAYTALVSTGLASLPELVRKMSTNPARILGLPFGEIRPGATADLALLDIHARWRVEGASLRSKSKNTAFQNMTLQGRVVRTLRQGETTFSLT